MVEKMKYINITGPGHQVDRVAEEYLSRYDIQLEYATKELRNEKELKSFSGQNPYAEPLGRARALLGPYGGTEAAGECEDDRDSCFTRERALEVIGAASRFVDEQSQNMRELMALSEEYLSAANDFAHFADIEFNVEDLARFEFLRYHFGKMPSSGFKQFEEFLHDMPEVLLVAGKSDGINQWCVYFTTSDAYDRVESIFSSLHFEKAALPLSIGGRRLTGKPETLCKELTEKAGELREKVSGRVADTFEYGKEDIIRAYKKILSLSRGFDARKYAAITPNQFFIFVGWMSEKDAYRLKAEMDEDKDLDLIIEDDNEFIISQPPVRLKNPWPFKPFEFFIRMYGLPSYDEVDPTPFVAATYTLLFGAMFADVGQGAVIALLGLFLGRKRGMALGNVMTVIGCSSALFGFLFGSFFGFEFTPVLTHPAEPENMMSTLLVAVAAGILLILSAITLNIINAAKKRRVKEIMLSPNGPAGLWFYGTAAIGAANAAAGGGIPGIIIIIAVMPIILMTLKKPLETFKGSKGKKESVPMTIFETIIEMFEIILSFFTNTVSFLRVGAFAVSHAAIMGIVWMLSRTAAGANNPLVLVFGNILVLALEGLIVGIQVLRLQFYEMFSRFYEGRGRAFEPFVKPAQQ